MIRIDNKDILEFYFGSRSVEEIYLKDKLVWSKVKEIITTIMSCYYNGYWIDEYPWTDDTPWID